MSEEEKEAIEYIKFKTITGLETLQLEKDVKALEILLNYIDTLQEENKKYIDIFNSTEKIMNGQERTKDKLLKENVELQKENEDMREELQMYVDTPISKLKEENKVLKEKNKYLQERLEFRVNYCNELEHELYEKGNYIHKEAIKKKIKELEQENKKHTFCRKADIFFNENAEMEMLNTYAIMKLQDLLLEE